MGQTSENRALTIEYYALIATEINEMETRMTK